MTDRLSPAAPARASSTAKNAVAGAMGAAATLALAMSLIVAGLKPDEGLQLVDYLDIARIPTACYGHTGLDVRVGRRRTPAECDAMLATDVAPRIDGVKRCVPALTSRPYQLAASTRLAFNIGVPAFCGSSTATAFRRGDWRRGCDLMLRWDKARVRGELVAVRGLALRRQREREQCLTGLAA